MSTHPLDLIPAYALGILEDDEAAVVEEHVAICLACQKELAAYEAVTAVLPLAVPTYTPPASLLPKLHQRIHPKQVSVLSRIRQWLNGRPAWQPVLAGALFVLVVALTIWQLSPAAPQTTPPTIVLNGTENAPQAQGILAVQASQDTAVLTVTGLPTLPPDKQYQLWLVQDGQRTNGGVFSVQADGTATLTVSAPQALDFYDAFGVTIEPAGGSPGPTGSQVLGSRS